MLGFATDIFDAGLSAKAKYVYCLLAKFANREGYCWPSLQTLAKKGSVARTTLYKPLIELEASGWIVVERRKSQCGDNDVNKYFLPRLCGKEVDLKSTKVGLNSTYVDAKTSKGGCEINLGVGSNSTCNLSNELFHITNNEQVIILKYLQTISGYPFEVEKDLAQVNEWMSKWPADHVLSELEKFGSWWRDKESSFKGKKNFRSSITNWLKRSKVEIKAAVRSAKRLDLS